MRIKIEVETVYEGRYLFEDESSEYWNSAKEDTWEDVSERQKKLIERAIKWLSEDKFV
ncbi:MAG: hypothetical protein QG620_137 [Patescibacteria group bacterium]|nr:hypothetical protein [Patescibacteria group bacterium]